MEPPENTHKMSIHADIEIDMEYHRQLKLPSKQTIIDAVELAMLEVLQKANPEEQINPMDVKAQIPNGQIKR